MLKNKNIKEFLPLNINNLHNSLSEDKYKNLLTEILSKWKKDPELILMTNIENQKTNLKLKIVAKLKKSVFLLIYYQNYIVLPHKFNSFYHT